MKRFVFLISCLVIPLLTLVLSITLIKDPGEILAKRYLKAKDIILDGQNVKLYSVPAQWGKFQEAMIIGRKAKNMQTPDIVTWGSSRSSEIRADLFPKQTYYNCVIPGSNILDYVSMYEMYKKHNALPKTVIINIDPWTFYTRKEILKGGQTYSVRDKEIELKVKDNLNDYLTTAMKDLHQPLRGLAPEKSLKVNLLRYSELLSPSYFQSSLKVIDQSPVSITSESYIPNSFVIRKDGSYTLYQPNAEEVNNLQNRSANFAKLAKGDFYGDDCADGNDMNLFVSFLNQLKEEHIHVILFVSPIHPMLYDGLEGHEKKLVETKINNLAKANNILIVGSYDPHRYQLQAVASDPDFIDEYHVSYKAMKVIFDYHRNELKKCFTIN